MKTDFTPKEVDAMPNLARLNVKITLHSPREGDPMFYYDSSGDAWQVIDTEIGYAKERFAPWG